MSRTASAPAIASQNAQNTAEVYVTLVSIAHPTLAQPIRVCDDNANVTSNGDLYVAWDFGFVLPGQDPDNPATAKLSIGNVDPLIIRSLRQATSPPSVTVTVVLASSPDVPEVEFDGLILRNATYDAGRIDGDLAYEEILSEPVATSMTPADFPGLF